MNTAHSKAIFGEGFVGEVHVFLANPHTYMNLSGESVRKQDVLIFSSLLTIWIFNFRLCKLCYLYSLSLATLKNLLTTSYFNRLSL
ncbi:hypothetical protein VIGAN_05218100 [Vigna angularis var. angularis]|uniref:Uncharacterized protein n=1 Tax=Vigna angularis var. angularis TaxID=157739 RepID=A0A0S3S763_PHAAN|nr:hypothetical protein VIGAN_05218100 [Vigna angularis var. angularis]